MARFPLSWGWLGGALGTLLGALLVVVFVAALFLAVVTRANPRGFPSAFGHRTFVVLSGSMTGTFDVGDLIVDRTLTPRQAQTLRRGQVISFEVVTPKGQLSSVFTHRIYRVRHLLNARTQAYTVAYETKGDANSYPDGNRVLPAEVLGVYQYRLPDAGYVLDALHQPWVFVLMITVPFALLVAGLARRRLQAIGEEEGRGKHIQ